MKKRLLVITALLGCGCARADVLALPQAAEVPAPTATLPDKGMSMEAVMRAYGAPQRRYPAVGGDSPKQPPITRWDYESFSVFFEYRHVIDAVAPAAPAPIARHDGLVTPAQP